MAVEGDWKIRTIRKVYTILWRCHTGEIGDKLKKRRRMRRLFNFNAAYSAASTASPISRVPTCLQPGVRMSPVR